MAASLKNTPGGASPGGGPPGQPGRPSGASPGRFGKILVVDDEETMRRSLADILRLEGYQVHAVASGQAALDALRSARSAGGALATGTGGAGNSTAASRSGGQNDFDVILLDLKMPEVDGLEVLRAAGRIAPDTMVILLTAHGSLESAIEAIRYQAHDYLLKPATPQQIVNSVMKAIGRRAELLHKRAVAEQRGTAQAGASGPGAGGPGAGEASEQEVEPRLISLSKDVVVDLARREIWRRGGLRERLGDEQRPRSEERGAAKRGSGRSRSEVTGRGASGRGTAKPGAAPPGSAEEHIRLTPTEARLLKVLLENRGRVLTHRELVLLVQGYEVTDWEAPEVLRPLVSRLRQKLHHFPDGDSWIVNVRGTGYVLERRQKDYGPVDGVERRQRK